MGASGSQPDPDPRQLYVCAAGHVTMPRYGHALGYAAAAISFQCPRVLPRVQPRAEHPSPFLCEHTAYALELSPELEAAYRLGGEDAVKALVTSRARRSPSGSQQP